MVNCTILNMQFHLLPRIASNIELFLISISIQHFYRHKNQQLAHAHLTPPWFY